MSAHTPGPWAVLSGFPCEIVPEAHRNRPYGGSIYEAEDRERYALRIASADTNTLSNFAHEIPREQAKANAHLIAAAPDLLEALRVLEDAYTSDVNWNNRNENIIAKARAAISKATAGEHPSTKESVR